VIVDPPRGWPASVSRVAATKPPRSKPGFFQKSLSSTAVVASISSGRDVREGHQRAVQLAERRELDLAGSVIDDGRLVEREVVEGGQRIGQIPAVVGIGADRADESNATQDEEAGEEQQRDGESDATPGATSTSAPCGSGATVPLTPLEARLHVGGRYHRVREGPFFPHRSASRRLVR